MRGALNSLLFMASNDKKYHSNLIQFGIVPFCLHLLRMRYSDFLNNMANIEAMESAVKDMRRKAFSILFFILQTGHAMVKIREPNALKPQFEVEKAAVILGYYLIQGLDQLQKKKTTPVLDETIEECIKVISFLYKASELPPSLKAYFVVINFFLNSGVENRINLTCLSIGPICELPCLFIYLYLLYGILANRNVLISAGIIQPFLKIIAFDFIYLFIFNFFF
jgi:hypothetical protein